jgi:hypothetical protein
MHIFVVDFFRPVMLFAMCVFTFERDIRSYIFLCGFRFGDGYLDTRTAGSISRCSMGRLHRLAKIPTETASDGGLESVLFMIEGKVININACNTIEESDKHNACDMIEGKVINIVHVMR